jgi:hypothetical protein
VHRTLAAAIEAEELYLKHQGTLHKLNRGEEVARRCFTGIQFDRDAAESLEGKEALSVAALNHRVPCTELLADVAAYCNKRKLASRNVKDACEKLCMWVLLKKNEVSFILSLALRNLQFFFFACFYHRWIVFAIKIVARLSYKSILHWFYDFSVSAFVLCLSPYIVHGSCHHNSVYDRYQLYAHIMIFFYL